MVIILPIAYVSILMAVGNSNLGSSWRQAALRAAMLWMGYLVLLTEFLSLFNAITPWALFVGWLIPIIAAGIFLWQHRKNGNRILLPKIERPEGWLEWVLLGGIAFYLGMTALVAFLAPPNTFDSLNYHMARVAHWAQNQSLRHFITGLNIQNTNTTGAEMAVLNTFVLAGGDRWSNFFAWAAYAGSALGAAWIAACFGAPKAGQWLGAIFALTLPMGIAQSTSTMNDGVAAFWLVCTATEVVSFAKEKDPRYILFAGLGAGAAFLTKSTSASYLFPMGIWLAVLAIRHLRIRQVLLYGSLSLLIALILNAGFFSRNLSTYRALVDPSMTELHSNQLRNWQGVTSNFLRTIGQQMSTPIPKVNAGEYLVINGIHRLMGIDINDPRITSIGKFRISTPSFNEIRVTNPAQIFLALFAILVMMIRFRKIQKTVWIYLLVVFSGLLVYSYLFKWQIFGSRLHLSFMILLAPLVGYVLTAAFHRAFTAQAASVILLLLSLPWLFRIEQRPLLNNPADIPLAGKSLLNTSRGNWYYVTAGDKSTLKKISDSVAQAKCDQAGIVLSGSSPEYLYWVALNAPRPDMRIEWITSNSATLHLEDPSFKPCAVICESCGNDDYFNNLVKVLDTGSLQLFLEP
jgi:hypothetical protein